MDLIILILTTYFIGKKVEQKGYSSKRWRIRHVSACIFMYSLVAFLSLYYSNDLLTASASGLLAMIGVVIYRYDKVRKLPPADQVQ